MAVIKREPKASNLTIRLKPSLRAMAEKRAAEEGRSLASDISQLIVAERQGLRKRQAKKGF
jgi:predicted HicB family RNase H-like nuclease